MLYIRLTRVDMFYHYKYKSLANFILCMDQENQTDHFSGDSEVDSGWERWSELFLDSNAPGQADSWSGGEVWKWGKRGAGDRPHREKDERTERNHPTGPGGHSGKNKQGDNSAEIINDLFLTNLATMAFMLPFYFQNKTPWLHQTYIN